MMFATVRKVILDTYKDLKKLPTDKLVEKRVEMLIAKERTSGLSTEEKQELVLLLSQ